MPFLKCPHLPERPITAAIVSGKLPDGMRSTLYRYGVSLYDCPENLSLPKPVRYHPDLSLFYLGCGRILVDRSVSPVLPPGMEVIPGTSVLQVSYPRDIAYDACQIGKFLFCKPDATDPMILQQLLTVIPVRQGYAKCSVAIVNERAAITEDCGLADAMRGKGIDVLLITPGCVGLPGYNCGFIGGACGKIAPDILAFFGDISRHPCYKDMVLFCRKYGVSLLSLSRDILTDYGSLFPISE